MELSVILLLGSLLTLTGLQVPGWEGWLLAVLVLVAVRPLSCIAALWGSQLDGPEEKSFVAWFGVRGVGSLFYLAIAVEAGVLAPRRAGPRRLDGDRRRAHLDRRARHHGRAVDAAAAQAAASCSTAAESASSLSRSSTARSSAGWWIGSSPGSIRCVTRSSAGRIVSPAWNASNTRGSM